MKTPVLISRKVPLDQDCFLCAECFQFQNISHYCCKSTDTRAHAPNDSYCTAILFTLSNHYKCSSKATKSNFKQ